MTDSPPAPATPPLLGLDTPAYCPSCSYDLRGLAGTSCPECGSSFDPAEVTGSRIPWRQRHTHGRLRCFWRTIWHVLGRRRAFHAELHYPVNLPAALSFRRVTLLHVVGPLALLAVAGLTVRWLRQPGGAGLEQVLFEAAIAALLAVALWLFLTAATDAPRAVLERCTLTARQRSSVGALTYYTCGPLALSVPLGLLCIFLGLLGTNYVTSVYGSAAVIAAFLVPLAIPLAWIFALARLAREGLGRSEFSVLRLSLSLWARWCWAAIVFLGLLPFGGLYIAVALLSMLDG